MLRSLKLQCQSGRPALGSSRLRLRTPASAGHPSQSSTGRDRLVRKLGEAGEGGRDWCGLGRGCGTERETRWQARGLTRNHRKKREVHGRALRRKLLLVWWQAHQHGRLPPRVRPVADLARRGVVNAGDELDRSGCIPGAGGATYGCIGALGHVVADAKGITLGYGRVDVWPEACQGWCDSNSGRRANAPDTARTGRAADPCGVRLARHAPARPGIRCGKSCRYC